MTTNLELLRPVSDEDCAAMDETAAFAEHHQEEQRASVAEAMARVAARATE